jgi:hypothetical protein
MTARDVTAPVTDSVVLVDLLRPTNFGGGVPHGGTLTRIVE